MHNIDYGRAQASAFPIELDEAKNRLKFKGADKAKGKRQKKAPSGARALGRLFASVEAGGDIKGDIEWRNPEAECEWRSFLGVGPGVSASAGIGGEFDIEFKFDEELGKFMLRAKVGVVLGLGASSEVAGAVDANNMWCLCSLSFTSSTTKTSIISVLSKKPPLMR